MKEYVEVNDMIFLKLLSEGHEKVKLQNWSYEIGDYKQVIN